MQTAITGLGCGDGSTVRWITRSVGRFSSKKGGVSPSLWRNLKNASRNSLRTRWIWQKGGSATWLAEPPFWRALAELLGRQLIPLLVHPDAVQALAGGDVQGFAFGTAAKSDVGGNFRLD